MGRKLRTHVNVCHFRYFNELRQMFDCDENVLNEAKKQAGGNTVVGHLNR